MEDKKTFLSDKKNIIILILAILLVLAIIIIIVPKTQKTKSIDGSEYSSYELINMFEEESYTFEIWTSGEYTTYIILENESEGITIQRIYNDLVGTSMTFDDDTINDDMADLIDTSNNDTVEKKQQYEAFENWLDSFNITKLQVSETLDTYYDLYKSDSKNLDEIVNSLLY